MNKVVKYVSQAMSFRDPQEEALDYFSQIADLSDFKKQSKEQLEKIASENCEGHHTIKVDSHFDFVSYCFSMATGIGKTRLMGGLIYYLWKTLIKFEYIQVCHNLQILCLNRMVNCLLHISLSQDSCNC